MKGTYLNPFQAFLFDRVCDLEFGRRWYGTAPTQRDKAPLRIVPMWRRRIGNRDYMDDWIRRSGELLDSMNQSKVRCVICQNWYTLDKIVAVYSSGGLCTDCHQE